MSTKTFLNSTRYLKFFGLLATLLFLSLNTSCAALLGYKLYDMLDGGGGGGGGDNYSPTTPAIEASSTYAIPLGGVAPGRDELVIYDEAGNPADFTGHDLNFTADTNAVGFLPRPEYNDFAEGSGTLIVPQNAGTAVVSYYIDDVKQPEQFFVIVPPQSIIQMMVAEASTQLTQEAEVESDFHVKLTSISETADAIGAVTRNRVNLINGGYSPSVFSVSSYEWSLNPEESYYDAVINAESDGIYQYSPADPTDKTHQIFINAEARDFLDPSYHRAYDQAVLSSAYIFANVTADSTKGAFAFFSPDDTEWNAIQIVYRNNMTNLSPECGVSDADFPYFDHIQIVILSNVWKYPTSRPAFVFIREKTASDYAVVME